jgi:flagellar hook assembly protein FlgD
LVDEKAEAGIHSVVWDGRSDSGRPVASGVYLYRVTAGEFVRTRKMLLLK